MHGWIFFVYFVSNPLEVEMMLSSFFVSCLQLGLRFSNLPVVFMFVYLATFAPWSFVD